MHEQLPKLQCSRPVQQVPLHRWLPSGQSFKHTDSVMKPDSQYSLSPQHELPQVTPWHSQVLNDWPHFVPLPQHQP
ncbi:MAG TPA: hypothetical protein VJ454_15000 [Steroidobacteraceae bacterium]|nr:hypothetical protein [Steroidobacteraceae bacterium]